MSENPPSVLPYKWEARQHANGKWFYINHIKQKTQWTPPTLRDWRDAENAKRENEQRQAQESRASLFGSSSSPLASSISYTEGEPLPYKWEARKHTDGRWFFVNHLTKQTQWTPPSAEDWRVAEAAEREAQEQESAATSASSTSMNETTFTTQTSTLTEAQKRAMRRRYYEKYSTLDAAIVDAVLDSINYDENVATEVLDEIAGDQGALDSTSTASEDDDDDAGFDLRSLADISPTEKSTYVSTFSMPPAPPPLPSASQPTRVVPIPSALRAQRQQQQQKQHTASSAAAVARKASARARARTASARKSATRASSQQSGASTATGSGARATGQTGTGAAEGGVDDVGDMTARVDAILADSQFADTLSEWGLAGSGSGRGDNTDAATAGDLGLGVGFGLGSDMAASFGGADAATGDSAAEAEGGLGFELPASDVFANDMAAMADLFSTELAEQEQVMGSPFGDADATNTRSRAVPSAARGSAGASGSRSRGGTGATGSGLAQGADPSLRRGADKSLLLQRVVQPRGPNPAFRSKPGSSLAKGSDASLARGANKSLARGPANQRLR